MSQEAIKNALDQLHQPDVRVEVMLASTPEVRRAIIGSLRGVKELLELGPEAEANVLEFFEKQTAGEDDELVGVALYLMQRIPSPQAAALLARYMTSGRVAAINTELAAQAFLTSARIETVSEDPVSAAFHAAEHYQ